MYEEHRPVAEKLLRMLLSGGALVGAKWYGTLIALVARSASATDGGINALTYDEIYLSIESRLALFTERPIEWPDQLHDESAVSLPEQVAQLARLSNDPISDVALGERYPHLIISFESGRTLFLDGHGGEFEPWTIETTGCSGGEWIIVATPDSDVVIFDPRTAVHLG